MQGSPVPITPHPRLPTRMCRALALARAEVAVQSQPPVQLPGLAERGFSEALFRPGPPSSPFQTLLNNDLTSGSCGTPFPITFTAPLLP